VRRPEERGQLSAFVAILVLPLVLVVGLVADGGGTLAAHEQAVSTAFEAARAGAQAVDLGVLRATGRVLLDAQAAVREAGAFLSAVGDTGSVSVAGNTVTVTVVVHHRLSVLSAIGVGPVTVRGTASATATQGVAAGP
jgi:hypothetical protein